MSSTGIISTPIAPNRTLLSELPSDEEIKELTESTVEGITEIAGPIYQNLRKKLALIYFKEKNDNIAIFQLAESHGCSLRHQAVYRYDSMQWDDSNPQAIKDLGRELNKIVALNGQYTTDKYQGLLHRLEELPSEWTIVQLTVQYDPLLRITYQPVRKLNPVHITRMSCGSLAHKIDKNGQGGPPLSVCTVPNPDNSDILDIVKTLIELLENAKSKPLEKKSAVAGNKTSILLSDRLKVLIAEFEQALGDMTCILPGSLVDNKLNYTICSKVDQIIASLPKLKNIPTRQRQLLYLLASSPGPLATKQSAIINSFIKDKSLAKNLYDAVKELHCEFEETLSNATRNPVIIVLDQFLDIFPVEMLQVLKKHPVSRVPSIHFAHALYHEHGETTFRSGIDGEDGYYIVNPSGDLPKCEEVFKKLLPSAAPKWDGVFGAAPTSKQFIDALTKHSIFLYCGHGGGNQYTASQNIELIRTKAVTLLFGCGSSRILPLGGRCDGHSVFNSYIIAGCPCTVGMLWDVMDRDANAMSEHILERWLKSCKSRKNSSEDVCKMVKNLSLQDENSAEPELLRLLPPARAKANYLRYAAAMVVRGLPVKIRQS